MRMTIRALSASPVWRILALAGAGAALIVAAVLDELGRLLLSAHMVQHLLLTMVAPLLLVVARPGALLRHALPPRWRRAAADNPLAAALAAAAHLACRPLAAWILFCGAFVLWHLPGPYQLALRHDALRGLAMLSFFAAGLAFWTAVAAPAQVRRHGHGVALLMVVTAAVVGSLPGALMIFAPRLLYPIGADTVAICGLTPLQDQQLAGLLMWLPMDAVLFAAAACLFVAWLREAERRAVRPREAVVLSALLLFALLLAGCSRQMDAEATETGGDAQRGAALMQRYGCGSCHVIPGIAAAQGLVGPPLTQMGRRVYIAGVLRNRPDNMMAWLQNPQRIVPGNAMPDMGVGSKDARDLTAYLATLR